MQHKFSTLHWGLFALSLLALGCGSRARDDVHGGESHFLKGCESTCGGGLACIDEHCTLECNKQADCNGLADDAVCVGAEGEATCNVASAAPCEEGGRHYALNDGWTCENGCSCTCMAQGVAMLAIPCGNPPGGGCQYDGNTYAVGDEWTCSDGCNTCTCLDDGTVTNTDRACTTCSENDQEYQLGDVVELGGGTTCVCVEPGLLGQCTGLVDDGGPATAPAVTEPSDSGTASDDRERCYLPPDSGDCDAAFPAIYFDAASGQCLQFIYGGCGGNANRFDALDECYAACGRDAN
jgi:hypothetical protein